MKLTITRFLAALCLAAGCGVSMPVFAQAGQSAPGFVEKLADPELLAEVRKGGFVLYMRHGNTDNSRPDRVPHVDLKDCTTQRPLNEEGRKVAAVVGKEIRNAKIPLGEIFYSPLCRARESAQLAFPDRLATLQEEEKLLYTANLTTAEKQPNLAMTRRLLSLPVAAGVNRVLVAHAPNMADLIGYFVKPEGTVVVIKPLGDDQFEYLGSIHPTMWKKLAR